MPDESKDASSLYLVDESLIVAQNDAAVLADAALRKHIQMINRNLDFIDKVLRAHAHRSDDELMVLRLAVRCFNSGAAALRLARCGYYSQCLALIRDIMESTLLLDLFKREPTTVARWRTASATDRERNFGPIKVRLELEKLDKQNGGSPLRRDITYKRFCTYGAHPSPEGFVLISPNMMTQIGPFPDTGRMKAMVEEIVQHLTFATIVFSSHIPNEDLALMQMKADFYSATNRWADEFIRPSSGGG